MQLGLGAPQDWRPGHSIGKSAAKCHPADAKMCEEHSWILCTLEDIMMRIQVMASTWRCILKLEWEKS